MDSQAPEAGTSIKLFLAWIWVGIPLACGVIVTLQNAVKLFQ
jgi:hypothetical protein